MSAQAKVHLVHIPLSAQAISRLRLVAVISIVVAGLWFWRNEALRGGGGSDPRIGFVPPSLTLPLARGGDVTLNDADGDVVLLNFWSLWCAPCEEEFRHLQRVYDSLPEGVKIVTIVVDDEGSARDQRMREYLSLRDPPWPILMDYGAAALAFDIRITPTTIVLDSDGRVDRVYEGLASATELEYAVRNTSGAQ